ncbi:hypothetical protein FKW77_004126 [Venturia effusa]|uniref:Zn(2)-C6 fungal-type domain-containing protein n=1 Tax=Venturia effusa TaxID=50376 RepID=A0A517LAV8_9PEZI|nr:hypothetical protein FKW77_004126 [Venturia effusa]
MEFLPTIQDSDDMFGMEVDWMTHQGPVNNRMQGIDLVSDPITASDLVQAFPMQHSISMPMTIAAFSSGLSFEFSGESQSHSLPQTYDLTPDSGSYLNLPWDVPALYHSSSGSSIDTETYLNGLGDLTDHNAIPLSPENRVSLFLHPSTIQHSSLIEATVSRAESNNSLNSLLDDYELAAEKLHLPARSPRSQINATANRQSSRRTKRSSPGPIIGKKSPRGRKGPLKMNDRLTTSEMRKLGACKACRDRKIKCDKGLPCQACINYYKGELIQHPCRGVHLGHIADKILLCGNIFPKDHGLFGKCLHKGGSTFTVHLEIGFGKAFAWPAEVLLTEHGKNSTIELRHTHVVYQWRASAMTRHYEKVERLQQHHQVFPALLMDTENLVDAVDKHIESLLDERVSFQSFPLHRSPLQVLKAIYLYYKNDLSNPRHKQLLQQALKLLITIHICGDIKISPNEASQSIINDYLPNIPHSSITPCFIRSQLGPVFKEIASKLMKEVLTSLELHCLDKTCAHFPLVICTFAVLFMSVESIHYHAARDPYHIDHAATAHNNDNDSTTPSSPRANPRILRSIHRRKRTPLLLPRLLLNRPFRTLFQQRTDVIRPRRRESTRSGQGCETVP